MDLKDSLELIQDRCTAAQWRAAMRIDDLFTGITHNGEALLSVTGEVLIVWDLGVTKQTETVELYIGESGLIKELIISVLTPRNTIKLYKLPMYDCHTLVELVAAFAVRNAK